MRPDVVHYPNVKHPMYLAPESDPRSIHIILALLHLEMQSPDEHAH